MGPYSITVSSMYVPCMCVCVHVYHVCIYMCVLVYTHSYIIYMYYILYSMHINIYKNYVCMCMYDVCGHIINNINMFNV